MEQLQGSAHPRWWQQSRAAWMVLPILIGAFSCFALPVRSEGPTAVEAIIAGGLTVAAVSLVLFYRARRARP